MRPIYLFFHIQKTGGATLRAHLRVALRRQGKRLPELWASRENVRPANSDEIDLVVGHGVTVDTAANWFPGREPRYFTVLRDPVAQTISAYNWNCFKRKNLQQLAPMSFEEWFIAGRQSMQARALVRFANKVAGRSQQVLYERARAVLRQFWLVGRTENLEASLQPIFAALSVPASIAVAGKVAGSDIDIILRRTPDVEAVIREKAIADMLLYEEFCATKAAA